MQDKTTENQKASWAPAEWQSRTIQRLTNLGYSGFAFGPGINWWPTGSQKEKLAGPFTSTEKFDEWLAEKEAEGNCNA